MSELPPGRRERGMESAFSWKEVGELCSDGGELTGDPVNESRPCDRFRAGRFCAAHGNARRSKAPCVAGSWFPPSSSRRGRLATSFQPDLSWFLDLDPESIG